MENKQSDRPLTAREKRARRLISMRDSVSNISKSSLEDNNKSLEAATVSPLQEAIAVISLSRQKANSIKHERETTNGLAFSLLSESLADILMKALPLEKQYLAGKETIIHENAKEMFKHMFELGTLQLNSFSLNESLLVRNFTRSVLLNEEGLPDLEVLVEEAAKAVEDKVKEALKEEIKAAKERTKREESLKKVSEGDKKEEQEETPEEKESSSEDTSGDDLDDDTFELDEDPSEGSSDSDDDDKEEKEDDKKSDDDKSEDDKEDDKKEKKEAEPLEESYSVSLSVFPALVTRNTRFNTQPTLMGSILHECAMNQYSACASKNYTKVDYNDILAEAVINYTFIETLNTMRVLSPETSLRMLTKI